MVHMGTRCPERPTHLTDWILASCIAPRFTTAIAISHGASHEAGSPQRLGIIITAAIIFAAAKKGASCTAPGSPPATATSHGASHEGAPPKGWGIIIPAAIICGGAKRGGGGARKMTGPPLGGAAPPSAPPAPTPADSPPGSRAEI